jgi:TRAP-type mannitol/chloroaromatic compound transport system substrate-binding protein
MTIGKDLGRALACGAAVVALLVTAGAEAQEKRVRIDLQGGYGSNVGLLGPTQLMLVERINKLSNDTIQVRFHEPNTFVPNLQSLDAVGSGALDAAWTSPGYWTGKDTAFNLIGAVPFGPSGGEYIAWMRHGGGQELWDELYAQYNVKAIHCGMIPPEGSGWFRKPIESLADFQGMKMRFYGLGAKVMEKLGVSTQLIGGGEIFQALQLGTIDATEFSMPSMDLSYGFYQVAKHYYFPGWHQQSTFNDLIISMDKWNELSEWQRTVIQNACDANILAQFAMGEAIQGPALAELKEKGVQIHMWPDEILDAMRDAWAEVVEEEKAKSEMFTRMWDSLEAFRAEYENWKVVGYLP